MWCWQVIVHLLWELEVGFEREFVFRNLIKLEW